MTIGPTRSRQRRRENRAGDGSGRPVPSSWRSQPGMLWLAGSRLPLRNVENLGVVSAGAAGAQGISRSRTRPPFHESPLGRGPVELSHFENLPPVSRSCWLPA
jgi:hypothetical protein